MNCFIVRLLQGKNMHAWTRGLRLRLTLSVSCTLGMDNQWKGHPQAMIAITLLALESGQTPSLPGQGKPYNKRSGAAQLKRVRVQISSCGSGVCSCILIRALA